LMSVVKRIISDSIERVKVDELLADEYEQAGYGGITLTKTPLGTQINLYAMRPGRVIGKRGRAIKQASERLEQELDLPNPQITVVEVEFPELNPRIMAARIANALERGVHYRRAIFWSLNRIMEAGAIGCEIVLNGPLRSNRGRYEKVSEGYVPKSGDPALKYVKTATVHVKMKKGVIGVNVTIVPPEARFPDKVEMGGLPEIEYPEEEYELPEGVEPEAPETPETSEEQKAEAETTEALIEETEPVVEPEEKDADVETPVEETLPSQEEVQPQSEDEAKLKPDEEKSEPGTDEAPEVEDEAEEEKEG
jgi:small subunit ribosomal protein S3